MLDLPPDAELYVPPRPAIVRAHQGELDALRTLEREQGIRAVLPGVAPVLLQPVDHQISYLGAGGSVSTTNTWNHSASLGAADPRRYILVAFNGSNIRGVTNISIAGVAMTWITPDGSGAFPQIYMAKVPTGTSGSFTVSFDGDHTRLWFYFWRLIASRPNFSVLWRSDLSATSPLNSSLAMPAGSVSVIMARNISNSAISFSGTGVSTNAGNEDGFLAVAAGSAKLSQPSTNHTMAASTSSPGSSFRAARVVIA